MEIKKMWRHLELKNEEEESFAYELEEKLNKLYKELNKTFKLDFCSSEYNYLHSYIKANHFQYEPFQYLDRKPKRSLLEDYEKFYENGSIFYQMMRNVDDYGKALFLDNVIYYMHQIGGYKFWLEEIYKNLQLQLLDLDYENSTMHSLINRIEDIFVYPLIILTGPERFRFSANFQFILALNFVIFVNYILVRKLLTDYFDFIISDHVERYKKDLESVLELLKASVLTSLTESDFIRSFEKYLKNIKPIEKKKYMLDQYKFHNSKAKEPRDELSPRRRFVSDIENNIIFFEGSEKLTSSAILQDFNSRENITYKMSIESNPMTHLYRMFNIEEYYLYHKREYKSDNRSSESVSFKDIENLDITVGFIRKLYRSAHNFSTFLTFDKITVHLTEKIFDFYNHNTPKVKTQFFSKYLIINLINSDDLILNIYLFKIVHLLDLYELGYFQTNTSIFIKDPISCRDIGFNNFITELNKFTRTFQQYYAPEYFEDAEKFYQNHFPKIKEYPSKNSKYILNKFLRWWCQPEEYVDPLWKKISGSI